MEIFFFSFVVVQKLETQNVLPTEKRAGQIEQKKVKASDHPIE
jgi:hypothetical protein